MELSVFTNNFITYLTLFFPKTEIIVFLSYASFLSTFDHSVIDLPTAFRGTHNGYRKLKVPFAVIVLFVLMEIH